MKGIFPDQGILESLGTRSPPTSRNSRKHISLMLMLMVAMVVLMMTMMLAMVVEVEVEVEVEVVAKEVML